MKVRKLFFLTLCLFILGGCGLMKNAEEREERHQKLQDEMMAYMENKYGEKFKGDSMEYVLTAEGGLVRCQLSGPIININFLYDMC